MWHFGSKCQRIGALLTASHKRLNAALASGVKKLGLASVALKLGEFPLFDNFFDFSSLDLNNFRDLANFASFNFSDFLACFTSSLPNSLSSPLLLFFSEARLLLLFLLEADLLPSFLLRANLSNDLVTFYTAVSETTILLKPWMNC